MEDSKADLAVPTGTAESLFGADGDIYNALTHAVFIIRCLRDGVEIGDKLPDGLARIERVREVFAAKLQPTQDSPAPTKSEPK